MTAPPADTSPPAAPPLVEYPAGLYAAVHSGTPGDLEFYRRACEGASSILELGCGEGRVLRALASVPGRRCVGIELHPGLRELGERRLELEPPASPVELIAADMRDFQLTERFERILLPHGSIYCLLDDDALAACLRRARDHLAPGGELWLDAYAADDFHAHSLADDAEQAAQAEQAGAVIDGIDVPPELVKEIEVGGRRYLVTEKSRWEREAQRIDAVYLHTPTDGSPAIECLLSQRYLLAEQLLEAMLRAGLEPIALFGAFDASPYDPELAELLVAGARLDPAF